MARDKTHSPVPDALPEAAEYVLGVMNRQEREAFQARLKNDASLRAAVVYWENSLAPLAESVAPVTPPASAWRAIESRLFPATSKTSTNWWNSLGFWRGLSFASVAAAVILGGVLTTHLNRERVDAPDLIAEVQGETKAVRLAVAYQSAEGSFTVNRIEGAAAPGRSFELWLIEGENKPVSLGVLSADARSKITIPVALRGKLANAILAISDEPSGGSPTGQPTGAVLATGKLLTI